jgi:hypothetical protein
MRLQKAICVAALGLIAASLLLVATDGLVGPVTKHIAGNCPVCTWASSLAVAQVPARVTWSESTVLSWAPRESAHVVCEESFYRPFSARAPPAPESI